MAGAKKVPADEYRPAGVSAAALAAGRPTAGKVAPQDGVGANALAHLTLRAAPWDCPWPGVAPVDRAPPSRHLRLKA